MMGPEPQTNAFGGAYDGGSYGPALEGARHGRLRRLPRAPARRRASEGRYLGVGFSPFVEPTGWAAERATANGLPIGYFDTAQRDGRARRLGHRHHRPALARPGARDDLRAGRRRRARRRRSRGCGSSTATRTARRAGMGTYASRGAVIGYGLDHGGGRRRSRDRLQQLAGDLLEASPEDIELARRHARRCAARRSKSMPMARSPSSATSAAGPPGARPAHRGAHGDPAYDPAETYANGCAAVVVEVDVETGIVTVEQIVAVEDCGVVLNPMIVEGPGRGRGRERASAIALLRGPRLRRGRRVRRPAACWTTCTRLGAEVPTMEPAQHRDAVGGQRGRGQGRRRGGHDLDAGGDRQRGRRRAQPLRRHDRPDPGHAGVPPRADPGRGRPSDVIWFGSRPSGDCRPVHPSAGSPRPSSAGPLRRPQKTPIATSVSTYGSSLTQSPTAALSTW